MREFLGGKEQINGLEFVGDSGRDIALQYYRKHITWMICQILDIDVGLQLMIIDKYYIINCVLNIISFVNKS